MRNRHKEATISRVGRDVPDHIAFPLALARLSKGMKVTDTGCWVSRFAPTSYGYVQVNFKGKRVFQHRLSYMIHRGHIPDGLYVLHTCDNRRCWNPEHLWLGTISDNKQDELKKGRNYEANRTHCPRGHSYEEHGIRHGRRQWRQCRVCARARNRLRAGWPEELAYSLETVSPGHRPLAKRWPRKSKV